MAKSEMVDLFSVRPGLNGNEIESISQLFRFIISFLKMWAPWYQFVLLNTPVMIPIQQAGLTPIPFSIMQPISAVTNALNTQDKKKQIEISNKERGYQSEDSSSKEQQPQTEISNEGTYLELLQILKLVISKIDLESKQLEDQIFDKFSLPKTVGKQFFANLISKSKKLTKTKQEIIKYCMRKAFKFVSQKLKENFNQLSEDDNLREFLKGVNEKQSHHLPFKKHSQFKTMNTRFLAQLFSSSKFVELYHQFLKVFPSICQADNEKKVGNLAKMMLKHIVGRSRGAKRFNNFKRIPWTQNILDQCLQLSQDLLKYSSGCHTNADHTDQ